MRVLAPRIVLFVCLVGLALWGGLELGQRYAHSETVSQTPLHQTRLSIGQAFPDLSLTDMRGSPAPSPSLLGEPVLVCLLAIGCDPCTGASELLQAAEGELPDGLRIIGVCPQSYDQLADYQVHTGFPYDLYSDDERTLTHVYGCERFPAAIGVDATGRIRFVREGLAGFEAALSSLDLLVAPSTAVGPTHGETPNS